MSEDNQQNGTTNGDVPEIELIIKVDLHFYYNQICFRIQTSQNATFINCNMLQMHIR